MGNWLTGALDGYAENSRYALPYVQENSKLAGSGRKEHNNVVKYLFSNLLFKFFILQLKELLYFFIKMATQ